MTNLAPRNTNLRRTQSSFFTHEIGHFALRPVSTLNEMSHTCSSGSSPDAGSTSFAVITTGVLFAAIIFTASVSALLLSFRFREFSLERASAMLVFSSTVH